jgi:hypothetical protein
MTRFEGQELDLQGLTSEDDRALQMAELYRQFPEIADATKKFQEVLQSKDRNPEFSEEMESALVGLRAAIEILEISLENQEKYGLVDKRWMRDTKTMRNALERGRLAMELDVRTDKDNEFWVSHALGARATSFPPFVRNMTTQQMHDESSRYHLGEGLDEFATYNNQGQGHRLILELKTLGDDPTKFPEVLQKLEAMIREKGIEESVAVASLSPGILMATHEVMPRMPLILNGGIVAGISYNEKGEKLVDNMVPTDKKWRAFGVKPFGEVVVSAGDTTPRRVDGQELHTGYALTRLPNDLVQVLRKQTEEGQKHGGLVSLSAVTIMSSVLESLGAKKKAVAMRKYYADIVNELGLGKMATTWGQSLSKIPGLQQLSPEAQLEIFKRELGSDTVVYTKSPEDWAHNLPPEINDLLKK